MPPSGLSVSDRESRFRAEGYAFRSREEIDRFLAKLGEGAASSDSAGPSGLVG